MIGGLGITREVAGRWREWEVGEGGWYVIGGLGITGEEAEGVGGQRNESAKEGEGREWEGVGVEAWKGEVTVLTMRQVLANKQ